MKQYIVECEACSNTTYVENESNDPIEFCPVCGRRAEVEERKADFDWQEE